MLFFGHPGFNIPLENGEVVDTVNGFQIVEADEIRDLPESERDNAQSFEIDNEIISDNEQGFDNFGNLDRMDNSENDNIKNEVLGHFRNYKNNIIRNKDSNTVIRTVELE